MTIDVSVINYDVKSNRATIILVLFDFQSHANDRNWGILQIYTSASWCPLFTCE